MDKSLYKAALAITVAAALLATILFLNASPELHEPLTDEPAQKLLVNAPPEAPLRDPATTATGEGAKDSSLALKLPVNEIAGDIDDAMISSALASAASKRFEESSLHIQSLDTSPENSLWGRSSEMVAVGQEICFESVLHVKYPGRFTDTQFHMRTKETVVGVEMRSEEVTTGSFTSKVEIKKTDGFGEGRLKGLDVNYTGNLVQTDDGDQVPASELVQVAGVGVEQKEYGVSIYRIPAPPFSPGREYSFTYLPKAEDPAEVVNAPPTLTGRFLGFHQVNGKPAVLFEAEQLTYLAINLNGRLFTRDVGYKKLLRMKQQVRFYIDLGTGCILWSRLATSPITSDSMLGSGAESVEYKLARPCG